MPSMQKLPDKRWDNVPMGGFRSPPSKGQKRFAKTQLQAENLRRPQGGKIIRIPSKVVRLTSRNMPNRNKSQTHGIAMKLDDDPVHKQTSKKRKNPCKLLSTAAIRRSQLATLTGKTVLPCSVVFPPIKIR